MEMIPLTPAEHAEVLRQMPTDGPIYLTVESDRHYHDGNTSGCQVRPGVWQCATDDCTGEFSDDEMHRYGSLPPSRFVEATGPCETCDGAQVIKHIERHWCYECDVYDTDKCHKCDIVTHIRCPSCEGTGRKRVALAVEPVHVHDRYCAGLDCIFDPVVFAHATVEVLPVVGLHDARVRDVVWVSTVPPASMEGTWYAPSSDITQPAINLNLDPLPVPGRDWIVVLDELVLA